MWLPLKKKQKQILPILFFVRVSTGATCDELMFPVVSGRCCTADAESTGLLTNAYLTSHIFKVLYFYVSNSNCNLIYTANGFLYIFPCLSVPWCFFFFSFFFFFTMKSLWYSRIFTFFYHICKAELVSNLPENLFAVTLYVVIWKINL